jgi:hypothetical protein
MPYIKQKDRQHIDPKIKDLVLVSAGELNYTLTKIVLTYLETVEKINGKVCYQDLNDIIGALEGCKLEFYRRKVADFERKKCNENGDVY